MIQEFHSESIRQLEQKLTNAVRTSNSDADMDALERAIQAARNAHDGQARDDGSPYVLHPLRTALILVEEWECYNIPLICAALLHDVIEDYPSNQPIVDAFDDTIRRYVHILTKPPKGSAPREEINRVYFDRIRRSEKPVQLLKLADKIDNVRDAVNCPEQDKQQRTAMEARKYLLPIANFLDEQESTTLYSETLCDAISQLEACFSRKSETNLPS